MMQWLSKGIAANYYRVNYIFWGIILYQYVVLLSHLWLPETTRIVTWTLLLTFIVEFIPGIHKLFRRAFQLIGILYIHLFVLQVGFIGGSIDHYSEIITLIRLNVEQFLPYLWFALAGWIFYLWTMRWTSSKPIIYTVIISSVLMFCIIDSFSFLILWDQVALIIMSGLLLITMHHFTDFSRKHPESWTYLKQYPGSIIRTIVFLISIIMIAGLLAPNMRPLLTDPYTAWKNYQGETVRTMGKGFQPINTSFGPGPSGYSRDDRELGSGFNYDYSSVMSVDTSHGSYWRGETRSVYTGKGWENKTDSGKADVEIGVPVNEGEWFDTSLLETVEATQRFTMLNEETYPVLFGAYRIHEISEIGNASAEQLGWLGENSELHLESGGYPRSYTIVSQIPIIDPPKLREARAALEQPALMEKYTQLPETVSERTRELAKSITEEEANDYDKVKAIEQYLRNNYMYNNQPDYSKMGEDFVDSFLFNIREGYCDYYSTAMAVMVRSLEMPARWVKGYTSGSQPLEEEYMDMYLDMEYEEAYADVPGYYVVSNANAHSWVEVYFEGYGWIPFEPTSGFSMPLPQQTEDVEIQPIEAAAAPNESAENKGFSWGALIWAALFTGIALLAGGVLYNKRDRVLGWMQSKGVARTNRSPNYAFIHEFNRFLRYARKKGFSRYEHETVRETLRRWKQQSSWLTDELEELVILFEQAKYSPMELSDASLNKALSTMELVKKQMK